MLHPVPANFPYVRDIFLPARHDIDLYGIVQHDRDIADHLSGTSGMDTPH